MKSWTRYKKKRRVTRDFYDKMQKNGNIELEGVIYQQIKSLYLMFDVDFVYLVEWDLVNDYTKSKINSTHATSITSKL